MPEFALPYEQAAMHNEEMPAGLSIYDQAAFQALRHLYRSHRMKIIDRAQASHEKKMIVKARNEAAAVAAFEQKCAVVRAETIRLTEAAKTACRKDPTPENAMRLVNVLDGLERSSPDERNGDQQAGDHRPAVCSSIQQKRISPMSPVHCLRMRMPLVQEPWKRADRTVTRYLLHRMIQMRFMHGQKIMR